ncbi:MAG: hypothetical protein KAU58_02925 [Candidatus Omnitrophica bacterium]|nr:hypothetical protein [Candidatus Omnitrophota bacterium]
MEMEQVQPVRDQEQEEVWEEAVAEVEWVEIARAQAPVVFVYAQVVELKYLII